ncbi:hypothetical protein BH10PAT1_BH10PAT1_2830 [soil metagenome]
MVWFVKDELILLPQEDVTSVVKNIMFANFQETESKNRFYDIKSIKKYSPSWLNIDSYLNEFKKLNSINIWFQLIDKVSNMQFDAMKNNIYASSIAEGNKRFYGISNEAIAISIATGKHFGDFANMYETSATRLEPLANILHRQFNTVPKNQDELYQRIRIAFPSDDNLYSQSFIKTMVDSKVFETEKYSVVDHQVKCPAIGLTGKIYQGVGEVLATDEYKELFFKRIVNNTHKRKFFMLK